MSSQTPDILHLSAALERFRSTRSAYLSTSDQATNALLSVLAETLIALRGNQAASDPAHLAQSLMLFQATRQPNLSLADQAQTDLLTALGEQMIALSDTPPAASSDSGIAALQSQIDMLQLMTKNQDAAIRQLRAQLSAAPAGSSRWDRAPQSPPVQPAMMRPLEYWAEHVPDYDDQVSPSQVREHLSKPRVRPEDVVLTPEDLRRIQRAERPPYQGDSDMVDPWERMRKLLFTVILLLMLLYAAFVYF